MTANGIVATGAILGGLAVAIGAFGAHGLAGRVAAEQLAVFEIGVRYHFYHALALVLVGLFAGRASAGGAVVQASGGLVLTAWLFLAGVAIFSGSLYVLVLTGQRWLGAVTPIGGLSFIAGWVAFARAALAGP
ncbi:MAG: DUF423 domain-containing protein [Thermodesulfobacteriota bacterium]